MPTESDDAGRSRPEVPQDTQPALTLSRGARVFRGMMGMGMAFGAVGGALIAALALVTLVLGRGQIDFDDDLDFMIVAPFVGFGIAFGLGMLYGGLVALVARGRSFRDVSIAHVAAAGAAIGTIPALVVAASDAISGGSFRDALEPLMIFPPLSAVVATATLIIARRAKPELPPGSEPHEPSTS